MSEFRFANLSWIHGIWIVLAIAALLLVLEVRGRSVLDQLVSRLMQTRLVHRTSMTRRVAAIVLAVLSMILLIVALMRPQWGRTVEQTMRIDSQIMVCLDVSKSMLAEDVAPSRLERAKVELDSLLGLMSDGQQVGLIAFAGKASVLCPMTTDFGFLRLVLAESDPASVGQGGTKIGTAIQKALDGFREAGDINRMILLITDGEDHSSFPDDAADRAKENGVRIVAVGFGDEAGSKIEITDPKTGVRSFLKDRDGRDVTTRLDGETLRKIALKTEGAYVPAGTGALDLDSIYTKHIETMLQGSLDSQQRVIRNEAYQWFVLAAIVTFIMALAISTPWNLRTRALIASASMASEAPGSAAVLIAILLTAQSTSAQQPRPSGKGPAAVEQDSKEGAKEDQGEEKQEPKSDSIDESLPPRTIYNQALALLSKNPDRAERLLNHARRDAGTDGELRFRTLYNLGWVEVNRADSSLKDEPETALQYLHQAANRFREAIRVRPDSKEARQNLEIVSRRILELTDALRKKDPSDLASRLDELIKLARDHQGELQGLVQQVNQEGTKNIESFRAQFRGIALSERQMISDTQQFSEDARSEMDALVKKPDDEKAPADKMRAIQLENMLTYIDSGIQRMGKARSLSRRLQSDGAFRRWSSSLSDLKRARDQLRNPAEVLGQIIGDATEAASVTQVLAVSQIADPGNDQPMQVPAWITKEFAGDSATAISERISELEHVFTTIVESQNEDNAADDQQQDKPDPRTTQLLKNMEEATPLMGAGRKMFEESVGQLESDTYNVAHQRQVAGIAQLNAAWELLFDIKRLIELVYQQEKLVQNVISQIAEQPSALGQVQDALAQTQERNLQRCDRLAELLDLEKQQLPPATSENADPKSDPAGPANADNQAEQVEAERQRLDLAEKLLSEARAEMEKALAELQREDLVVPGVTEVEEVPKKKDDTEGAPDENTPPGNPDESNGDTSAAGEARPLDPASAAVDRSIESLEELRRLYFSIVEHLRDTAQRQANLNDETTELAADEKAAQQPQQTGPLAMRQQQLQSIAEQIAEGLSQQGEQAAAAADQQAATGSQGQEGAQDPAAAAETLRQAAGLVDTAQKTMLTAAEQLLEIAQGKGQPNEPFNLTLEKQAESLQKLLEALALLQDNQQDQQQNQGNQQNQDQQQQEQDDQQKRQQSQQQMNASQLLQLIRDREAERRKDKRRRVTGSSTVEKDW